MIKQIKYIIKRFLSVVPLGKHIAAYIGYEWATKRNLKKIKFQGQFFQDMIAFMYLSKNKDGYDIKDGFYIDIGANDGIMRSNTYIFEQLGWKGICVEPQKDIFDNFLTKFRKCECYDVAISSSSNDDVDFFKASQFSGINESINDGHKNWAKEYVEPEMEILKTIDFNKYKFRLLTIRK